MADEDLGRTARLAGGPAAELVQAGHRIEIEQAERLAAALSLSDLAHAVALIETGAMDAAAAAGLTGGLLELHEIPPAEFPWDPERGDARRGQLDGGSQLGNRMRIFAAHIDVAAVSAHRMGGDRDAFD